MKTIIAGSRNIFELRHVYDAVRASGFIISEVVSGVAPGIDILGEVWAKQHGIPIKPFPAAWDDLEAPGAVIRRQGSRVYNAMAGFDRNELMAVYAEALIAVWNGHSRGTLDMIQRIEAKQKRLFVYDVSKVRLCAKQL